MRIKSDKNLRYKLSSKSIEIPDIRRIIREDEATQQTYVANIAMAFKDEVWKYKRKHQKAYLNNEDIHNIANKAAKQFITVWTLENIPIAALITLAFQARINIDPAPNINENTHVKIST